MRGGHSAAHIASTHRQSELVKCFAPPTSLFSKALNWLHNTWKPRLTYTYGERTLSVTGSNTFGKSSKLSFDCDVKCPLNMKQEHTLVWWAEKSRQVRNPVNRD
ncbi:hypothetical protein ABVK25_007852 [Lepraria finkii]|uniref:Uncharacterized protein n=1 Tax=Lepraria finkii TaxID=1340010 RepID=A0ABR4B208_9LECA